MKGLIPQAFIDEILAKTDIISFIDGYVPLKKQGANYSACCPFHDEKTPSFNVIAKKQFYHCFGCGASGNVIGFTMAYLNQEFPDAVETLATRIGLTVPRDAKQEASRKASLPLYDVLEKVAEFYVHARLNHADAAADYLKTRAINEETLNRFQIGYASASWHALEQQLKAHHAALITTGMLVQKEEGGTYSRYRNRIMFPIRCHNGRLIGFGGRAIEPDQKPKYLNSPETIIFQKSRELYGLHQVLELDKNPAYILIVEGYMDVLALSQHGIHAVATLGTATSAYHIQRLIRHTANIIFCFDGDAAGQKAAFKALESTLPFLTGELSASFIFLPEGDDPDSLIQKEGKQAFSARIQKATPLHEYLFETLTKPLDMTQFAAKSQLLKAVIPFYQKVPDGPYKALLLEALARMTQLDADRIENILAAKEDMPSLQPLAPKTAFKRTPLRLATALLLQNPSLYIEHLERLPKPEAFTEPSQEVLKQLLEHLMQYPQSTTASLVEAFRHTTYFDALNKLAAWEHLVPEEALETEFIETLLFLTKQNDSRIVEALIKKARVTTLSDTERQTLTALLQNRHRITPG